MLTYSLYQALFVCVYVILRILSYWGALSSTPLTLSGWGWGVMPRKGIVHGKQWNLPILHRRNWPHFVECKRHASQCHTNREASRVLVCLNKSYLRLFLVVDQKQPLTTFRKLPIFFFHDYFLWTPFRDLITGVRVGEHFFLHYSITRTHTLRLVRPFVETGLMKRIF